MNIRIWWIILKETDHLEDLSVVGRKILKWMLNKSIGRAWEEFIWFRIRKGAGRGEHGNKPRGFHKM